jgi:stress response protein SCP2
VVTQFGRGQKSQLSAITQGNDLYIGVQLEAPGTSWDISCFGLDADDRLSDDRYFVFFNQPKSPEGSIQLVGAQRGDTAGFQVSLGAVPAAVGKLSFCAAIDGAGSARQIVSGYFRIVVGGQEVMRYAFTGADFTTERAVMIGDVYRKGVWRVAANGQGFAGGLAELIRSYGGEVEDEPAPPPPPAPPRPPAPSAPRPPAAPPAPAGGYAPPRAAPGGYAQPPVPAAPPPLPAQAPAGPAAPAAPSRAAAPCTG